MPSRIEDYALIGDTQTAALVSREGSIDWLCLPRFDSGACFAALLGTPEHGRWKIAPVAPVKEVRRRYLPGTLILETEFVTEEGTVALIDFMPPRGREPDLVRIVEGRRGSVRMAMELIIRFDYGWIVPWVRRIRDGISAVGGPDGLYLHTPAELRGENLTTVSEFTITEGRDMPFVLAWHVSHEPPDEPIQADRAFQETERWWQDWSSHCRYQGQWQDEVHRSLITLKALTFAPTGGIVAAPTTSLPERLGGVRNWDYRFCWIRDATFTLYALLLAGFHQEAEAWREWLLRAVAGRPNEIQIMYGPAGERRLTELEVPWLPGYEKSAPVRIGNAAAQQFQLDVYGEIMDALHQARRAGLESEQDAWRLQHVLMESLESLWTEPDEGIWEVRGPRRHFTHSKVMVWVAFDRAVKAIERYHLDGPLDRWRRIRQDIHDEVCREGFNPDLNTFVQSYGSKDLDASLLVIPLVGFLPPRDPRVLGTIRAIERELTRDGLVYRYASARGVDGLPSGEGAFLLCSFWLADNLVLTGRHAEARRLFEQLLGLRNDVGLLAEQYDPLTGQMLGNFPQAFSHVGLINTAYNLSPALHPAEHRKQS